MALAQIERERAAMDRFAPMLVEMWCRWMRDELWRAHDLTGEKRAAMVEKIKEAEALAQQMRAWQETHWMKVPD